MGSSHLARGSDHTWTMYGRVPRSQTVSRRGLSYPVELRMAELMQGPKCLPYQVEQSLLVCI